MCAQHAPALAPRQRLLKSKQHSKNHAKHANNASAHLQRRRAGLGRVNQRRRTLHQQLLLALALQQAVDLAGERVRRQKAGRRAGRGC